MLGATMLPNGVSIGRPPANGWLLPGTVWQLAQSDEDREVASAFDLGEILRIGFAGHRRRRHVKRRAAPHAPCEDRCTLRLRIDQRSRVFEILIRGSPSAAQYASAPTVRVGL